MKKSKKKVKPEKGYVPYQCDQCGGSGMIPSEDGSTSIDCPKCEGSGKYKPFP